MKERIVTWCFLYKKALRDHRFEGVSAPPTVTEGGIHPWSRLSHRDEIECGRYAPAALYNENHEDPTRRVDHVISLGYQAYPPTSFLDLLPTEGGAQRESLRVVPGRVRA